VVVNIEQVGDAGPILNIMAVTLENISSVTTVARATISAVFRTAQIVAALPNVSYQNKVRYYPSIESACFLISAVLCLYLMCQQCLFAV